MNDETLPSPIRDPESTVHTDPGGRPPERIGPYRILETLGEGGMGVVYLAEQKEPIQRRVALKVIKLGMDTREVVRRFEAERQALAVMSHPNIAKVHDAGVTEDGRPFFAMEWIRGIPITKYCDRHRLGVRERLELFVLVCQAVQHAHQKGVIHRDLKPSNLLVTVQDGVAVPKVIDFGIAKAVDLRLGAGTLHTIQGEVLGTPEYMSPEQAETTGLDVDTRTDVYSLGVILYRLLSGTLPFDSEILRRASITDLQRIIRDDTPLRPSTRFGKLGARQGKVAARRSLEPAALTRQLRSDLDWIVLKAMEKDRTRRYDTTSDLAMDIRRYLSDQPVLASPPGRVYLLRKFAKRHRGWIGAAAAVTVALAAGLLLAVFGLLQARAERDRAVQAELHAAESLDTVAAINAFLNEMLESADPNVGQGEDLSIREVLDRAVMRIDAGQLAEQPMVEAELRSTIGRTYYALGDAPEAVRHLTRAVELSESTLGPDHGETGTLLVRQGWAASKLGDHDLALPALERGTAVLTAAYGPDHPATLDGLVDLGLEYHLLGRNDEALDLLDRAVAGLEDEPDFREAYAQGQTYRGTTLEGLGRLDEAIEAHRHSVRTIIEAQGEHSSWAAVSINNLAATLEAAGRYEEAEKEHRRALAIYRDILPADHSMLGGSLGNLGLVLSRLGRSDEAEPLQREALRIREAAFPPGHPAIAIAHNNLGLALVDLGRLDEAEASLRKAVRMITDAFGPDHLGPAVMTGNLGNCLSRAGERAEGEELLLDSHRRLVALVGEDHQRTQRVAGFLEEHFARIR